VEITRRQLLGGTLGFAAAGFLASKEKPAGGYSVMQSTEGPGVTSGRVISCQFENNVTAGSLLVAVISRKATRNLAPTIGQVSDNKGDHWRQAVEFYGATNYGVDIWYCEHAGGGNRPTVTATGLGYPVHPGITGMNMQLLEYGGASGFELCDQICQTTIKGTSVTVATNFALRSNHELAISVLMGDMSGVTLPAGWNARLTDPKQKSFVADNLDTGASSAGVPLSGVWNLQGGGSGVAIMATFVPRGVSARKRRLVQSSYTDSAILPTGKGHADWTSQPFPVDPKPGNTLIAFMNGSIYHPSIECGSIVRVTDSAGGVWHKLGESGADHHTGINISCWMCPTAVGGRTALTAHFSNASQQLACLLLEFANLPRGLKVVSRERRTFGSDIPPLSTGSTLAAGGIALAFRTSIFVLPEGPGSSSWTQILSDTTGANALMMLSTPDGVVTADWSGAVVDGGLDILLLALAPTR
jgi:hypothetical protein